MLQGQSSTLKFTSYNFLKAFHAQMTEIIKPYENELIFLSPMIEYMALDGIPKPLQNTIGELIEHLNCLLDGSLFLSPEEMKAAGDKKILFKYGNKKFKRTLFDAFYEATSLCTFLANHFSSRSQNINISAYAILIKLSLSCNIILFKSTEEMLQGISKDLYCLFYEYENYYQALLNKLPPAQHKPFNDLYEIISLQFLEIKKEISSRKHHVSTEHFEKAIHNRNHSWSSTGVANKTVYLKPIDYPICSVPSTTTEYLFNNISQAKAHPNQRKQILISLTNPYAPLEVLDVQWNTQATPPCFEIIWISATPYDLIVDTLNRLLPQFKADSVSIAACQIPHFSNDLYAKEFGFAISNEVALRTFDHFLDKVYSAGPPAFLYSSKGRKPQTYFVAWFKLAALGNKVIFLHPNGGDIELFLSEQSVSVEIMASFYKKYEIGKYGPFNNYLHYIQNQIQYPGMSAVGKKLNDLIFELTGKICSVKPSPKLTTLALCKATSTQCTTKKFMNLINEIQTNYSPLEQEHIFNGVNVFEGSPLLLAIREDQPDRAITLIQAGARRSHFIYESLTKAPIDSQVRCNFKLKHLIWPTLTFSDQHEQKFNEVMTFLESTYKNLPVTYDGMIEFEGVIAAINTNISVDLCVSELRTIIPEIFLIDNALTKELLLLDREYHHRLYSAAIAAIAFCTAIINALQNHTSIKENLEYIGYLHLILSALYFNLFQFGRNPHIKIDPDPADLEKCLAFISLYERTISKLDPLKLSASKPLHNIILKHILEIQNEVRNGFSPQILIDSLRRRNDEIIVLRDEASELRYNVTDAVLIQFINLLFKLPNTPNQQKRIVIYRKIGPLDIFKVKFNSSLNQFEIIFFTFQNTAPLFLEKLLSRTKELSTLYNKATCKIVGFHFPDSFLNQHPEDMAYLFSEEIDNISFEDCLNIQENFTPSFYQLPHITTTPMDLGTIHWVNFELRNPSQILGYDPFSFSRNQLKIHQKITHEMSIKWGDKPLLTQDIPYYMQHHTIPKSDRDTVKCALKYLDILTERLAAYPELFHLEYPAMELHLDKDTVYKDMESICLEGSGICIYLHHTFLKSWDDNKDAFAFLAYFNLLNIIFTFNLACYKKFKAYDQEAVTAFKYCLSTLYTFEKNYLPFFQLDDPITLFHNKVCEQLHRFKQACTLGNSINTMQFQTAIEQRNQLGLFNAIPFAVEFKNFNLCSISSKMTFELASFLKETLLKVPNRRYQVLLPLLGPNGPINVLDMQYHDQSHCLEVISISNAPYDIQYRILEWLLSFTASKTLNIGKIEILACSAHDFPVDMYNKEFAFVVTSAVSNLNFAHFKQTRYKTYQPKFPVPEGQADSCSKILSVSWFKFAALGTKAILSIPDASRREALLAAEGYSSAEIKELSLFILKKYGFQNYLGYITNQLCSSLSKKNLYECVSSILIDYEIESELPSLEACANALRWASSEHIKGQDFFNLLDEIQIHYPQKVRDIVNGLGVQPTPFEIAIQAGKPKRALALYELHADITATAKHYYTQSTNTQIKNNLNLERLFLSVGESLTSKFAYKHELIKAIDQQKMIIQQVNFGSLSKAVLDAFINTIKKISLTPNRRQQILLMKEAMGIIDLFDIKYNSQLNKLEFIVVSASPSDVLTRMLHRLRYTMQDLNLGCAIEMAVCHAPLLNQMPCVEAQTYVLSREIEQLEFAQCTNPYFKVQPPAFCPFDYDNTSTSQDKIFWFGYDLFSDEAALMAPLPWRDELFLLRHGIQEDQRQKKLKEKKYFLNASYTYPEYIYDNFLSPNPTKLLSELIASLTLEDLDDPAPIAWPSFTAQKLTSPKPLPSIKSFKLRDKPFDLDNCKIALQKGVQGALSDIDFTNMLQGLLSNTHASAILDSVNVLKTFVPARMSLVNAAKAKLEAQLELCDLRNKLDHRAPVPVVFKWF